jgi:hypothetical protein
VARTAVTSLALLAALGCGEAAGPAPSTPRIDYVDGAIEPVLGRGSAFYLEGFGFGDTQGTVRLARSGGGTVAAAVATWSDRTIRATVPDSAVSGTIVVTAAAGRQLSAQVHVLPHVTFDPSTLGWTARTAFPRAPVGVALAVGAVPGGSQATITLYAAGGAEPIGGDSSVVPDSGVYVATVAPGGVVATWARQNDSTVLPTPRAFAAAAYANRFNSRFDGGALYVIGGIDSSGRARPTVFVAPVSTTAVVGAFHPIEPLPAPVAGAIAVVRRGRIYVIGGTDSIGRPQTSVFVGRIGPQGDIDGWYVQPSLSAPRAYGGGLVLDDRAIAFGGVSDSVPPGGGLDSLQPRWASGDTAGVSLGSGFFSSGWAGAGAVLPAGRSQFATLALGDVALVVGGVYAGAPAAECLAATITGDSLGAFTGPFGSPTIAGQGGGTLVGPSGATWQDTDGSWHGIVLGGIDLATRLRRDAVWGF